jgi:hypothetical protein
MGVSISSYWPVVKYVKTTKGGKQPRTSAWWGHIKIFFWEYLIIGAGVPALAFLDTTSLGTGEFDLGGGSGLMFLIMTCVYGFTVVMNVMNYGAEKNWHRAMITYAGQALLDDEKYSNSPIAAEPADEENNGDEIEEEGEWLMADQDWSW